MTATQERTEPDAADSARWTPGALLRRLGPMVVALVALGSSVVALVFTLWPGLKPDPHTTYSADVSIFAVETGVTFGQYVNRMAFTDARRRALRADDDRVAFGKTLGEVVYVESTVEGFKHDSVTLRWSLYGAHSQRRVRDPTFWDRADAQVDLDAPTDHTVQLLWLPPPRSPGPFRVRVGIYDERDRLLDVADSQPFVRPRQPLPRLP